jgi:hypothetical protein
MTIEADFGATLSPEDGDGVRKAARWTSSASWLSQRSKSTTRLGSIGSA